MGFVRILKRLRSFGLLLRNEMYDARRYHANTASKAVPMDDDQLRARLFQRAHSIEKGLAMPEVRAGFGAAPLGELRDLLAEHEHRNLDRTDPAYQMARHAIGQYVAFHCDQDAPLPEALSFVRALGEAQPDSSRGGYQQLEAAATRKAGAGDFASLVAARRSVRMFSDEPVDPALVSQAVALALRSPSVCNRQSARARYVTDRVLLDKLLAVQGGSRGFGHQVPGVLVVTSYLGIFRSASERNQCWVDGGLFAMSLLFGLTYVGLGSCSLNWSADMVKDKALRSLLDLPENEVVIMLIAVGNLPESYRVATSPRLEMSQVYLDDGSK